MKIENLSGSWDFVPEENLQEGCEIQCPECKQWYNHNAWGLSSVYCELCGYHDAIECPNCKECFDHVSHEPFKCRI